jgi:hypothetical protein
VPVHLERLLEAGEEEVSAAVGARRGHEEAMLATRRAEMGRRGGVSTDAVGLDPLAGEGRLERDARRAGEVEIGAHGSTRDAPRSVGTPSILRETGANGHAFPGVCGLPAQRVGAAGTAGPRGCGSTTLSDPGRKKKSQLRTSTIAKAAATM